jgi:hypothetical protein
MLNKVTQVSLLQDLSDPLSQTALTENSRRETNGKCSPEPWSKSISGLNVQWLDKGPLQAAKMVTDLDASEKQPGQGEDTPKG